MLYPRNQRHEIVLGFKNSLKIHATEMKQASNQKSGHIDSYHHSSSSDVLALSVQSGSIK
jgi:hypothetical protein